MSDFQPKDPNFEQRVRDGFARQAVMDLFGARLLRVEPGEVDIELDYDEKLTQQGGFLHAGVVTTIADSACGFAGLTLMPAGSDVLAVEFKMNLMRPAVGERFVATGRVLKSGRTLTVCRGEVYAFADGVRKEVAAMQATMFCVSTAEEKP
ncbi:PaaI family thioesterase [Persicimonas caeni]|uniref:PaaI family thioesterase n=1 Tax=Persicimonas caeni TaxID=2292766 RepID=A0A4Y6PWT3_PERCE|nr:PaaI family thioesterase [Persicimonas caeni]QDG52205.1 PaaI family thioesterase [Persicimonas caeni]QED33427.1 PaaI family thioesterase [Persicimonas caeni]